MRKLAVCIAVLALTAVAVAQGSGATAPATSATPTPAPVKVGIIQRDLAITASNEGQRDFAAMQKKFEPRQAEIAAMQREIEELRKQAQIQGDKMSPEAQANLARNIEQKQKIYQRAVEDFRADVAYQQQEIAGRIYAKLFQTIARYASLNGYAVVLNYDQGNPQESILWAGQWADITKPVVDAYNLESGVPAPPPPAPSAAKPGTGTGAQAAPARPAASNPPPKPAGSNPPR
ncbi:MAG: OmpH family outer membrane protein [Terriglobales bacterium]